MQEAVFLPLIQDGSRMGMAQAWNRCRGCVTLCVIVYSL